MISNKMIDTYLSENYINDNSNNSHKIIKLFDLPKEVWNDLERQRRVYSIKGISPTILARSDSTKIFIFDKKSGQAYIRKFTPKENFRAQGFDEGFINNILKSGVSDTQLYKQSGNAVSPPMITLISNKINADIIAGNNKQFKFIDLFCGLGGFRIAAQNSGMQCVFSSDIDSSVREVYYRNFNDMPVGDITTINPKDIPDHDLLCAGFPCQPFSLAGKRLGFEDTRGTLFFEVAKIIKIKKPKFVLLENVGGLVNHDKGKTLAVIRNIINDLGYEFFSKVMNACDYGIPQNRVRWYGIAINKNYYEEMKKKNIKFNFPDECELTFSLDDIIQNNVGEEYIISDICSRNIDLHLADFLKSKRYSSKNIIIATEIRPSRCNFRCDGISPCLTAKMGTGGNNVPVIVKERRKYTEKECLRIMGFPDWYVIPKNKMQSYKQIGNSVVVPIVEKLTMEISTILKEIG